MQYHLWNESSSIYLAGNKRKNVQFFLHEQTINKQTLRSYCLTKHVLQQTAISLICTVAPCFLPNLWGERDSCHWSVSEFSEVKSSLFDQHCIVRACQFHIHRLSLRHGNCRTFSLHLRPRFPICKVSFETHTSYLIERIGKKILGRIQKRGQESVTEQKRVDNLRSIENIRQLKAPQD